VNGAEGSPVGVDACKVFAVIGNILPAAFTNPMIFSPFSVGTFCVDG
jgi:hypothetical protein